MSKTTTTPDPITSILDEIGVERLAQIDQWGVQDHPSSFGANATRECSKLADRWKQINAAREAEGSTTFDGILLEEVYEALAEIDPLLRRAELVQVAAVAAAEIEAIDRAIANGAYVDGFEDEVDEDEAA